MKVNERRTVVGVDWPLCVPPTAERDRRLCVFCASRLPAILVMNVQTRRTTSALNEIEVR